MNENKNQNEAVFSWQGPDYIKYEKGKMWYVLAFIVAVLLFTWALFENSIPMMASTICAVIAYYIYDQKMPQEVTISLSRFGISVGDKLTPFSEIKSFRIDYQPPLRALCLQPKKTLHHNISVLFPEDLALDDLRQFMLTIIPEQKPEEQSLLEKMLRTFRL